jgi:vacuolar-type H+-ATPase subunit F/Vma7
MAELKVNYLLGKKETAELYYLRGVTHYNLRKQKKAVQDFEKAYSMTNSSNEFQLQNAIVEALRKACDRKTWRKEKTIVAIKPEKYTDML